MSKYKGSELEIFEHANNWKDYYASFIKPKLGKRVAEVGAGIGGTTPFLCGLPQEEWICIEPDKKLLETIEKKIKEKSIPAACKTFNGYLGDQKNQFDSIIYIDVIEHIEDDERELKIAANLLNNNGHLVILVPAHNHLYTSFDQSIGHYRRYNRARLKQVIPSSLQIETVYYLDSVGFFASLMNKLFLKQSSPSRKQIKVWDHLLVPISRIMDKLLGYNFGKSLLLVARKIEQ